MNIDVRFIGIAVVVLLVVVGVWLVLGVDDADEAAPQLVGLDGIAKDTTAEPSDASSAAASLEPKPRMQRSASTSSTPAPQSRRGSAQQSSVKDGQPVGKRLFRGEVVWAADDGPVAGVNVTLEFQGEISPMISRQRNFEPLPKETARWTTTTDSQGKFQFSGVPSGRYGLLAEKDGAAGVSQSTAAPQNPDEVNFVRIEIRPVGTISGKVANSDGQPVVGAVVVPGEQEGNHRRLPFQGATVMRAETDDAGAFMVNYLPEGEWKLVTLAEGYATIESEQVPTGTSDLLIVLGPGAAASGQVVSVESGEAVPDFALEVNGSNSYAGRNRKDATTDESGRFEFAALADGDYSIRTNDLKRLSLGEQVIFTIRNGEPVADLKLSVAVGGVVTGQVYNKDTDEPVEGVRISARGRGQNTPQREATSDAQGVYRLEGMGGGQYTLSRRWMKGLLHNEQREDQSINLKLGQLIEDVDFPVKFGLYLRGKVVDEKGAPIERARVVSDAPDTGEGADEFTLEDGTFEHYGFSPNIKVPTITAARPGFAKTVAGPFELGEVDLEGVVIEMEQGASISGVVVDRKNNPLADMYVRAMPTDGSRGNSSSDSTGPEGAFKLDGLVAGMYGITLRSNRSYRTSNDFVQEISVAAKQDVTDVRLVYEEGAGLTITGRVLNGNGDPVAEASLNAHGNNSYGYTRSEEDGTFEITGLNEGAFSVSVSHQQYSTAQLQGIDAGTRNLDIELSGRGTVEGTVVVADSGEPLPSFELAYFNGRQDRLQPWMNRNFTAYYDEQGAFSREVEVGEGTLYARAAGYAPASTFLADVREGDTVRGVVIRLEPGGTVEGTVTNADGEPVGGAQVYVGAYQEWMRNEAHVATSANDGTFRIESMSPDTSRLSVQHADYALTTVNIELQSGAITPVSVVLSGGGTVQGVVRVGGNPAPEASVYVHFLDGGSQKSAQTDANGAYSISGLPAGEAQVGAHIQAEGGNRNRSQAAIIESGMETEVNFDFEGGNSTVEGRITYNGQPPSRAYVNISLPSGEGQMETRGGETNSDGTYLITGLQAGTMTLMVNFQSTGESWQARQVEVVTEEGRVTQRDVELNAGAKVSGGVSGLVEGDQAFAVVVKGTMEITSFDQSFWIENRNLMAGQTQIQQGAFMIEGLGDGDYTVIAINMGATPSADMSNAQIVSQPFTVSGGTDVQLDLAF
jgi:hypothetical protein